VSCGTTSYGGWGACGGFSGTCGESGTQSRTVTTYACGSGSCQPSSYTETQACTRSTTGASCGTTSYGAWGACNLTTFCGPGEQSRSVTSYTCSAGSCAASSSSEWQSCPGRGCTWPATCQCGGDECLSPGTVCR
jgi:hypothetical protein